MSFVPASEASPWLQRWGACAQPGQTALDLACGGGRHSRWMNDLGLHVTAVDRNSDALASLPPGLETLTADLESAPWPLADRTFDWVVVTNYLWRPLFPSLLQAVAPDGYLIYETFAQGQEQLGRPRNPDFLLAPGELLTLCQGKLHVLAYEDGVVNGARMQRVAARRVAVGDKPCPIEHLHIPSTTP
ncbi:class I SAM-dependent methyltransferase [Inhella gelatinilytica]|uniref:Class I SAM-dependent methyltransferase n=1 Tax=Inhella gelatinilytica TaxID=2795030 RepID=A0A931IWR2_9BURK|nr:class I SAM-dependent methyltransferase [Inhella gelatinilytica]MBH9554275.1 class I SAM-dependent methyltransferase [Inhella gelatinilytica]